MMVMTIAIVMVAADAQMNAGANTADMGSDADIGVRRRCAKHGQRKDGSKKAFHGCLRG